MASSKTVAPDGGGAAGAAIPQRIGRFLVLRQIGVGGMGVVYGAYDEELDRPVAIKLLHAGMEGAQHSVGQARLLREAQAMARVSHPNVAQVHDVGLANGRVFIAMELIQGKTVSAWLAEAKRGWREIVGVYVQAARGLSAAHAQGIIHRDFKPDNALVGDDGRVRVLDFSLARTLADLPGGDASERAVAGGMALTHVGKVIGTPAYMPPEQALGAPVDARADQFSFCVSLYEALFGRRPFVGATLDELVADTLRDRAAAPREHDRPAWLVRAVLRGLRADPERRWPTMDALLAELERDRIRWLRIVGGIAVLAALVGLVFLALELRTRRERAAREQAAAGRLVVLDRSLDRSLAVGARVDAEAALAAFTGAPEHRDTPALAAAYLGWSRRMQTDADLQAARIAAAQSYAAATDDAGGEAALEQLAALFLAQGAWEAAGMLVEDLRARRPELLTRPRWIGVAADAARMHRDFAGFAAAAASPGAPAQLAELAPLAAVLSHGTATGQDARQAIALAGDEPAVALLSTYDGSGELTLVRKDATLSPLGREPGSAWKLAGNGRRAPQLAGEGLLIGFRGEPKPVTSLLARGPDGLYERVQVASGRPLSSATADLDGDGVPTLYVGGGPPTRELLAFTPGPAGALRFDRPHPGTDATHSDIASMTVADLDGDGRDELIAAAGPWSAYDIRVFRAGPDPPELSLIARRKLGYVAAVVTIPGPDGRARIVAAKVDHYPSRIVFPPDRSTGDPEGLYVLDLRGDELVVDAYHPWPAPGGARVGLTQLEVGDLDGDGRLDVVVGLTFGTGGDVMLLVMHARADGALVAMDLAGISPLLVGQFDADPAAELLARIMPDDLTGAPTLWVLGAGDRPVPALTVPRPGPAVEPATSDPLLARAWGRAEQLAGLGLFAEAAQTIVELASLVQDPAVAAAARLRAADLYRRADRCDRATALYAGIDDPAALQGRIDCDAREGRFAEALAAADALILRADASPEARRAAAALAGKLRPGLAPAGLALRLDGLLDPRWQIADPVALRQDLIGHRLSVDALVHRGELASLPLECGEHALSLSVDLDVERMEWATGFELGVRSAAAGAPAPLVGVRMRAGGGGGVFQRFLECDGPDGPHTVQVLHDVAPGVAASYKLEVAYQPALRRLVCSVTGADDVRRSYAFHVSTRLPAGPCAVSLRARDDDGEGDFWARLHLRALTVGGVEVPAPAPAPATAARLLVEGEAHAALQALEAEDPGDPLRRVWRILALAELGRWPQAASALRETPLTRGSPARRALVGLLRTRSASFGPLARGALGSGAFRLHAEAFVGVLRTHADDPLVQRALAEPLSDPAEYSPEPDDGDGRALRGVFHLYRARMWLASGALDRAEAALRAGIADLAVSGVVPIANVPMMIRPALLGPALAAARGDQEQAHREIREALRGDPAPELLLDLMRLQPRLRALLDERPPPAR